MTVEVTTRFVTGVDTLAEAWAFVMDRIDAVGPDPSVTISPVWGRPLDFDGDDDDPWPRTFTVKVEGMVEEP